MKKTRNFTLLLVILMSFSVKAQGIWGNSLIVGDKVYPATEPVKFYSKSLGRHFDVSVAKLPGKRGYLVMSIDLLDDFIDDPLVFENDVILFLDDGSAIKCIDRKTESVVDKRVTSIYNLTASEIKKLAEHDIIMINFRLGYRYSNDGMSSYSGNYTAKNQDPNLLPFMVKLLFEL